ncbi:MAG: pyruvate, phosphate dikinase [Spirochaetaceae bacterium]|jgi:phosphoenolpyruvate synthase/pyruvate phosphate dikinase|nr:pyruvate, phosphate dikinase [Spirochaetaceae bacterium]
MLSKNVYFFGGGKAEGGAKMREVLGEKGANLAEMTNLGLPVPPGFTITTEACAAYLENGGNYPKDLDTEVHYALTRLEKLIGKKLGDPKNPLFVSVRPGTALSMNRAAGRSQAEAPSMESILNLGLNDQSAARLAEQSGDPRFAWDAYRRFIQMYACAVLGVNAKRFEDAANAARKAQADLTADDLKGLVDGYKKIVRAETKREFPQNVQDQLWGAIEAAFASRGNTLAVSPDTKGAKTCMGTAVTVQTMVFGNMGGDSGVGVCSSRDPLTGKNEFCGRYVPHAQGKDGTTGVREPQNLSVLQKTMPLVYKKLSDAKNRLEKHFRDMQEIEFTIQQGKLFLLQTDSAGRSGAAAVKCALDMVKEGRIDKEEAIMRVTPGHLDALFQPIPESAETHAATTVSLSAEGEQEAAARHPEEEEERAAPKITKELETFLGWCDEVRDDSLRGEIKGFRIRADADIPDEAKYAFEFGADGVGLCRTERMFFDPKKLLHFQAAILAETAEERKAALKKLLPFQKRDFAWLFKAMNGKPVVIRLLDPPLHEFVPQTKADTETLAAYLDMKAKDVQAKIDLLRERNLLDYRGCRLAVIYPEIYDIQIEAIALAAVDCVQKTIPAHPEIIVPLVSDPAELALIRSRAEAVWQKVQNKTDTKIPFRFGAMIETPRAAFLAKEIAEYADFFSFGTDRLTRAMFALSRNNAASFVSACLAKNLLDADPLRTIDERGVGEVLTLAAARGREEKGDLKCGLCGEHGGDPETIDFCYRAGLSYVSCPPCRIPLARLAGAQAVIRNA